MAKDFATPFYHSAAWRHCRDGYIDHRIAIDGGICEVCHERLGYIVHHKINIDTPERINNPDISLNWDNLRYECKECHDKEEGHGVGVKTEPVVAFDADGNPVAIRPEFEHDRT